MLPWEDILSVAEQFLEAYEFNVVDRDKWSDIEEFLKAACEQARLSSFARPGSIPAALAAPGKNAAAQPNQKYEGNIRGVLWKYMKAKSICCGYNTGSCQQKDGHSIGNSKVRHWCGGCFGASKGTVKEEHPAKTCEKDPWEKSLFQ